jgi:hypothetical protein
MLKTVYLDGKRNQCMDHLIHMFVKEFLPDIEHCHKQQTLGMEGPNLAEKCHQQILKCAPETPLKRIKKIDDLHFEAQLSNSLKCYQIDLLTITCNCSDFPNISLCKHIVAVMHFFGGADLGPQSPCNRSNRSASKSGEYESPDQPASHSAVGDNTAASVVSAANDSMNLLQQLITKVPRDPRFAKSVNVI